ncbi:sigma-54-dependent transcriptional regulator [Methylocystis heyeri]|uniref:Response regulator n=1 Tax=Methylocystis heyeri TaxID=391905 RepID=A0A6B8KL52_9HYPH|nr:sigma-54 dependent transcriptional regulator [Methylocystis heyeri]QGM47891.1 response regulator [Methylocystis heyeri]
MSVSATVLVIDDELRSRETLQRVLCDEFDVICVASAKEAEGVLQGELVQVILCDHRMAGESGVDFLKRARMTWPDSIRMIISGYADSEDIIAGVNEAGIYQYITKPWQPEKLISSVRAAAQLYRYQKEVGGAGAENKPASEVLAEKIETRRRKEQRLFEFGRIIHRPDSPVASVVALARRATEYDISVLITGASGTGKELLARAIHYGSERAGRPFVVQNCGALPDELLESELFGCKKGAYTGAYQDRIGLFELANGGSIFLDEIGETSAAFQVRLLRVLQEGEIRPLGALRSRKVNVRLIAATNRSLEEEVAAGRFRGDLYYRVAAFPIHLPPLCERPRDIELIANCILVEVNRNFRRNIKGFSREAIDGLLKYDWPGNVRELHNEIQRMVALSDTDEPLPARLLSARVLAPRRPVQNVTAGNTLKARVEALEREMIEDALRRFEGNISRAAEELGLSRVGLRNKIERYKIERDLRDDDE